MTSDLFARRGVARAGAAALCTVVLVGGAALPAAAKDGDVRRTARCGSGVVKLKLSDENGRIETELEVDTNRGGQRWVVRIFHDGRRVAKTSGVTGGRSGSFEVRRLLTDTSGLDTVRGTARRNGTKCVVTAAI